MPYFWGSFRLLSILSLQESYSSLSVYLEEEEEKEKEKKGEEEGAGNEGRKEIDLYKPKAE